MSDPLKVAVVGLGRWGNTLARPISKERPG